MYAFSYFNPVTIANFVKLNIEKNATAHEIAALLSTTLDSVSLSIRYPGHILTFFIVQEPPGLLYHGLAT